MAQGPVIRLDLKSGVPALRQIVDSMRVLLVEGQLAPETELSSVRRLAMELGVHFNTVAAAYRQLAAEGWLELKHGRGARVIARAAPAKLTSNTIRGQVEAFRSRLRSITALMRAQGLPAEKIATELRAMAEAISQ